jgi:nucleotide-binding universal stress UspA family protein
MKKILCPTDFSPVSQNALLYAVDFAKKSKATLILFHTEFIPQYATEFHHEDINIPFENIDELKERMEALIIQLKVASPDVNCTYVVEEGLVAENIALYANKHDIDLIIMGTSGVSGMEAIFTGSNSVRVMDKAKCPVLIIPEKVSYREPKRFVYATDLLDNEDEVVDRIITMIHACGGELELLHVKSEDALELVNSEASLGEIAGRYTQDNVRYKIIQGEDSISEIEDYAKSQADILILAQRKKSFLEKLFSKNRAEAIAYHAEIPLLVIHKS